jgi:hypothetical protein
MCYSHWCPIPTLLLHNLQRLSHFLHTFSTCDTGKIAFVAAVAAQKMLLQCSNLPF